MGLGRCIPAGSRPLDPSTRGSGGAGAAAPRAKPRLLLERLGMCGDISSGLLAGLAPAGALFNLPGRCV